MNEQTKKQRWIVKERERLLKEHHDYLEVIRKNEDLIQNNLWQIGLLHAPMRTLTNQYSFFRDHTFDEDQIEIMSACTGERTDMNPESTLYSEIKFGIKVLRKEQERLSNEIIEYRQKLKKRGDVGDSYKLFLRLSDDDVLSKKYDKLKEVK
tara:strand:- start:238 stop:693 length:456 start_codon:yes stop_codon:yes gene_type:complete